MLWLAILGCYLVGGIPFGLLLGRWLRGIDIRQHGSGNLGATNAIRILGKPIGFTVLLLDALKGWLPVFGMLRGGLVDPAGAGMSLPAAATLGAAAAILGHVFPVYLGFRGGKGVATAIGVIIALQPMVAGAAIAVFVVVFAAWRYVSLAAITAAVATPFMSLWLVPDPWNENRPFLIFVSVISALILYKHRANIQRLLTGQELRVNSAAGQSPAPKA